MNKTRKQLLRLIYFSLIILSTSYLHSQNCFDADFESGSLGGYTAFHGAIGGDGMVIFPIQEISEEQHKIMTISDGFDPIAEQFCVENKQLLVAGSGTGSYTLRLGDPENGAKTAKVVLSLDVTDNVSFFLLKYAIVINDPGHNHTVQPRFELNIKDQDGNILECGKYEVRAAENLDGFESCEDWRVRPWTAAGFELASFIGQTIFIEIISTDCGIGGHAGYAYIDATCSPLQLELESYCPGASYAKYVVTDGFDEYAWSTGETTSYLEIDDPVPGQEYTVTVTSSTGCTLVLKDTLPAFPMIEDLEPSFFDGPDTLRACFGEQINYIPQGTNIGEVEAIELGYSDSEFAIFANESQVINFVTTDNFGCDYDTTQILLLVDYLDVDIQLISSCEGVASGEIKIEHFGDDNILTALDNFNYQSNFHYTNLLPSEYVLNIIFGNNCEVEKNLIIVSDEAPEIEVINSTASTCDQNNGKIEFESNNSSIEYSLNGSNYSTNSTWNNLAEGSYTVLLRNGQNGCTIEETIHIDAYSRPKLELVSIDSSYCGKDNGQVVLDAQGGYPPLRYSVNGYSFQNSETFDELAPADYLMVVEDEGNCKDSLMITIPDIPFAQLGDIMIKPAFCREDNGTIQINVTNPQVPYELFVNDIQTNSLNIEDLESGDYDLTLIDHNACEDAFYPNIIQVPPPSIDSISYRFQNCGKELVQIEVHATAYNDSIMYQINNLTFTEYNSFELVPDHYSLSIEDELGCIIDTTFNIQNKNLLWMANIFTPDDDGDNDFFCCPSMDVIDLVEEFKIYDRWGNIVFSSEMSSMVAEEICWDGQNKNRYVENGVYVYYLRVLLTNGRIVCNYGDVTVLR